MIDRYAKTGEIINYSDPSPKQTERLKKHKRGSLCMWKDVKSLVECADSAEQSGWSKYRASSGERMVVMTQKDLDELLAQAKKSA